MSKEKIYKELGLPTELIIKISELAPDTDDKDVIFDSVSGFLSDQYEYCHNGFEATIHYNEFGEPSLIEVKNIKWDVDEDNSSAQENFITQLKAIRDYWLNLSDKSPKEVADGILFSLLVMFDGDSSVNDFHPIKLTDEKTGEDISVGYLHEFYHQVKD